MKHAPMLGLISLAALLVPGTAAAADFTFDVPVRLQNVPTVTGATVTCIVSRVALGGIGAAEGRHVLGRGSARISVSDGGYDATVTVEVNNTSIIQSSDARSYMCAMDADGRSRTGVGYTASSGNFEEVYRTATGQSLDRVSVSLRASLP